ncbi:hypothetical protein CI109_101691 [Kwoniella shandongensis]|uniref:Uncharacterized protein n=1 Tax=Kwoniella shandongensis TaxID=1734106 RepID=A0A5M6C9B3_9TREE|nr:uncharacterized protein CI109_001185 [Kwoniella shandongensis]KAA5530382.1 hypothetical protein CI109_001185 [Kwoniella shandongensis]
MSKVTFNEQDELFSPDTPYGSGPITPSTGLSERNVDNSASGEDTQSDEEERLTDHERSDGSNSNDEDSVEGENPIDQGAQNPDDSQAQDSEEEEREEQTGSEGSLNSASSYSEGESGIDDDQDQLKGGASGSQQEEEEEEEEEGADSSHSEDEKSDSGSPTTDDRRAAPRSPREEVSEEEVTNEGEAREKRRRSLRDHRARAKNGSTTPPGSPPASATPLESVHRRAPSNPSQSKRPRAEDQEDEQEDGADTADKKEVVFNSNSDRPLKPILKKSRRLRTPQENMIRLAVLYLFPVLLSIPISLLLSLNTFLLTPLYNSIPLTLHPKELYVLYAIPPSLLYCYATLHNLPREAVSARVCFSFAALSGDVVVVFGRKIGSVLGTYLGPEWGSLAARAVLGVGAVTGATGFALLCFDYILPIKLAEKPTEGTRNFILIAIRSAIYIAHMWVGEQMWNRFLSGQPSILTQSPEKSMLFISLLLTALSLVVRPSRSTIPFSSKANAFIISTLQPSPQAHPAIERLTALLPSQALPVLLLFRLPLLILALRQQIFLRPPTSSPYITAHGELRVLSSERSLTGQVVVAENLKDGYRFLRCDHSILGGRWIRDVPDKDSPEGKRTEIGDSIFATFNLQEVAVLAQRSDPGESLIKTLALTTDLEVSLEGGEEDEAAKVPDRALIIGLGAGIAASAFAKRGFYVDVVEIDPAVYFAAQTHFDLSSYPPFVSTNLVDGASFISQLAELRRSNSTSEEHKELIPAWDYVVQDCFTGGSVPGEMFTKEFWEDLGELMMDDGIVAMNFAGIMKSKASKAVLVTLLSVFSQCRAFSDGFETTQGPNDMVNMVVFCSKSYSPLLTFRPPSTADVLRSPLRSHVYSTFLPNEIQLDTIISEKDWTDPELMLKRGEAEKKLNVWQVGTSLATWKAMQKILTPEMWLAY